MWIEIEPLDTLFFRDGKPFTMGEESSAEGRLFPLPSVLYGAVRSAYLGQNPEIFPDMGSENDPTRNLKIKSIFYRLQNTLYLPLPFDLVRKRKDNLTGKTSPSHLVYPLQFRAIEQGVQLGSSHLSHAPERLLMFQDEVEAMEYGIINTTDFNAYLQPEVSSFMALEAADYVRTEPKVGIDKDRVRGNAADGKLYRVAMKRYIDLTIVMEIEGIELVEKGFLKLGGENKAAFYQTIELLESETISFPTFNQNDRYFKLCLTTPALFNNGWIPGWLDPNTLRGTFISKIDSKKLDLELIGMAMNRYLLAGGFDMKNKRPKPARRAVPAGSVFYFQLLDGGSMDDVVKAFHGQEISDNFMMEQDCEEQVLDGMSESGQGFGLAYVGVFRI